MPDDPGSILIAHGRVIDPASGTDRVLDVAIRGGVVRELGPDLDRSGADRVIDASGLLVTPGLIDPHVHLREPGQEPKETIETGTAAAVAGGFTTVCCMPNTSPAIDSPEHVRWVVGRAKESASCRVFPVAAGTIGREGEDIAPIEAMLDAGAVGISDDGDVIEDASMMSAVLRRVADAGSVFMQHCQDPGMTVGSTMHEGKVSTRMGQTGWPREAEESIIERDIELNRPIGARYHVQHLSSGGSVDLVHAARQRGEPVSAEASPHHLHLTDEACESIGTNAKMNPPLREAADVERVRRGVAEGAITVLATDHAPHTSAEKARPFAEAPFGIIGLESALALYASALVEPGHIGWPGLIERMTINPARLCGLDRIGLGTLSPGGPADVTLIDPELGWTLTGDELRGRSSNTPFLGRRLNGRAVGVIVAGRIALNPAGGSR